MHSTLLHTLKYCLRTADNSINFIKTTPKLPKTYIICKEYAIKTKLTKNNYLNMYTF